MILTYRTLRLRSTLAQVYATCMRLNTATHLDGINADKRKDWGQYLRLDQSQRPHLETKQRTIMHSCRQHKIQCCFLLCVPQRPVKWMRLFWLVRFIQYSPLLLLFNRWHKNANKCIIHSLSFTSKDSGPVSKKAALHFLGIWPESSSRKHIKHCWHTFGYLLTAW